MSDEDAHVGLTTSSSISDGAAAIGGPGALVSPSDAPAPFVRGGALSIAEVPNLSALPLPSPSIPASLASTISAAVGGFAAYESRLPSGHRVLDFGGAGDCCFNCFGVGAVLMGRLLPAARSPWEGLTMHQGLYGEWARACTVAHARIADTLTAVVAGSASGDGDLILFAEAIVAAMASWPCFQCAMGPPGPCSISVDSWLSAMSRSSSDRRHCGEEDCMGVYGDSGALLVLADYFRARVICKLIDGSGSELPPSPQTFLPREGRTPAWEIVLICQPDVHFMLWSSLSTTTRLR